MSFFNTSAAQPQQQQQAPTLNLFTNTAGNNANNNNNNAGTNIFGTSNTGTTGTGLFGTGGGAATGTSIFGANNNNNNNNAPAPGAGTGIFGAAVGAGAGTGTGLFGASNTSNAPATGTGTGTGIFSSGGGGIFGNNNTANVNTNVNNNATAPGTGLFGANTAAPGTTPALGGGLFANSAAKPATGLFGSSTTTQPTPGTGLFGASTAGTQPAAGTSIFGTSSAQPAAGTSTGTGTGMFGGSGMFGAKPLGATQSAGPFGNASTNNLAPPQQNALTTSALGGGGGTVDEGTRLQARIEALYQAWNPSSPQCRFQYIFYNRVDAGRIAQYGRPQNALNETVWARAVRDNPDPATLVPALATSFDDLRQRVDAQGTQAAGQAKHMEEIQKRLATLITHQAQNRARLAKVSGEQVHLLQRIMALVTHLHLLIPALRSSGLRAEEETVRGWLDELRDELGLGAANGKGNGSGRLRGKLGELWALVGALGAAAGRNQAGGAEWKVVDEDGLARIAMVLSEQQAGLQHLTKILRKDLADLAVVYKDADILAGL
ncbi:unnamed protein product [Mycena citricolor]|uniref:Nucleoporin Nup54 alpha-helical domain-containing protein n=1 Tax=Mycena citricolor TaxID=2018698 RepID=A0AAD2K8A6_9AGAR|nr:unnamed protein product [Mycena citricolor]